MPKSKAFLQKNSLRNCLWISSLVLLITPWAVGQTQEADYTGWRPHAIRTEAFERVALRSSEKLNNVPAMDPKATENSQAIRNNKRVMSDREIVDISPQGTYTVLYANNQQILYTANGKTLAVGKVTRAGYPQRVALYDRNTGKLYQVTYALSPKDVFIFDGDGNLKKGTLESALWDKPTFEKKVASVGLKLLSANHIKERITFNVEQDRSSVNAHSIETDNRVSITKGMLAYIESDDELAAVLGHEVAHIILRHRTYPQVTPDDRLRKAFKMPTDLLQDSVEYSKLQSKELDADRMGLRLMIKAGYNPNAAVSIFQKFTSDGSERLYSSHPGGTQRIQAFQRQIKQIQQPVFTTAAVAEPTSVSPLRVSTLPSSAPAAKISFNQWTAAKARWEILKYPTLAKTARNDWSAMPTQDPAFNLHIEVIQKKHSLQDHLLQYQEIPQLSSAHYVVSYPKVRAFITYTLSGQLVQLALCNQASFPRVCQAISPEGKHVLTLFEVSPGQGFRFDATDTLLGYQTHNGIFDTAGQSLAHVVFYPSGR